MNSEWRQFVVLQCFGPPGVPARQLFDLRKPPWGEVIACRSGVWFLIRGFRASMTIWEQDGSHAARVFGGPTMMRPSTSGAAWRKYSRRALRSMSSTPRPCGSCRRAESACRSGDSDGDPFAKSTWGTYVLAIDVDSTLQGTFSYLCWLCGSGSHEVFSACGSTRTGRAAVSTRGCRYPVGDEERQCAETSVVRVPPCRRRRSLARGRRAARRRPL